MKKIFFYLFLLSSNLLLAQMENNPCSAVCLGEVNGIIKGKNPPADGIAPNQQLPCGGGTSEDNPTWYTFVAVGTHFKITASTDTCFSGLGIEVTLFEGDDCGSIGAAGCSQMAAPNNNVVSLETKLGKQYWIQVDGLNTTNNYTWKIIPVTAGQLIGQGSQDIEVKWNQIGTFQLSATPKFTTACNGIPVASSYITVKVIELKESIVQVTLCGEQVPYDLPLLQYIKNTNPMVTGTPNSDTFVVVGPLGTTKTTTINYVMDSSGCTGKIKLTAIVKAKGIATLKPMLIEKGDSIKVGSVYLKCQNASAGLQNYVVSNSQKPNVCDTTYRLMLQCLSISPKIETSSLELNCLNNKSVKIDVSKTICLPVGNPSNVGIKSFLWSTGEKTDSINVSKPGTYKVTISYDFTFNTSLGSVNKKISKVETIVIQAKSIVVKKVVYIYTPTTIDLQAIVQKNYPTYLGTVFPSSIVIYKKKIGVFKQIVKVKDESNCEFEITFNILAVKKLNLKDDNPVLFKTSSADNFSFDEKNIRLYPNPSDGIFNLDFLQEEKENYQWQVFDLQGRLILKNENTQRIDLQNVSNGIYYLKVFGRNWNRTFKMVKQ